MAGSPAACRLHCAVLFAETAGSITGWVYSLSAVAAAAEGAIVAASIAAVAGETDAAESAAAGPRKVASQLR